MPVANAGDLTPESKAAAAGEALPEDYRKPEKYFLGSGTRKILRAMIEVIMPRNERIRVDCADELLYFVDNFVRYLPPMLRMGFPLGCWAFQLLSIVFSGRFVPFTRLSAEKQESYLRSWVYARQWWKRDLLKGLKGIVLLGFYQHPEVMKALDYDPAGHVATVKARRLASYADDI